jgi:hypothetical protein
MSWDIFVQDLPRDAQSIEDIPRDFQPKPILPRSRIVEVFKEVALHRFQRPAMVACEMRCLLDRS